MAFFAVAANGETDFRVRQCLTPDRFHAVRLFGSSTLEKLATSGRVEIQIAHLYDGTCR